MSYNFEEDHIEPNGEVDSDEIDLEDIKGQFVTYLDGKIAPLFAADALSIILGTEPPVFFQPNQVADLVDAWAQTRFILESKPVYEFYLKSVEMVVTADRTKVLTGFKPSDFYPPFFEALVEKCPESERERFREKLKQLTEILYKEWSYDFRRGH